MEMMKTPYARTLDSAGRLIVPAKLRTILGLKAGDTFVYYTTIVDGKIYLCIKCEDAIQQEERDLEWAIKILSEHGIDI